jgi:predicted flavoprotein YhiN
MDLKKAEINKLLENLIRMPFTVIGKTTFKEEFVTAGGISLKEFDEIAMNLKKYPTIYAAGEMLNIDGVTGGFNFQAAWTTAWFAANSIANKLKN